MLDVRLSPSSLHPHLLVTSAAGCAIDLHISLSDALFPDPSELQDKWPQPGPVSWTATPLSIDIERPLDPAANITTLTIAYDALSEETVEIPLHARYLPPRDEGWVVSVPITGKYDCGGEHVGTVNERLSIALPSAKGGRQITIEVVTAFVVWLGWAWISWMIWRAVKKAGTKSKVE